MKHLTSFSNAIWQRLLRKLFRTGIEVASTVQQPRTVSALFIHVKRIARFKEFGDRQCGRVRLLRLTICSQKKLHQWLGPPQSDARFKLKQLTMTRKWCHIYFSLWLLMDWSTISPTAYLNNGTGFFIPLNLSWGHWDPGSLRSPDIGSDTRDFWGIRRCAHTNW